MAKTLQQMNEKTINCLSSVHYPNAHSTKRITKIANGKNGKMLTTKQIK